MILVTGASGLVGSSVVREAARRGEEVVGLYHSHDSVPQPARAIRCDIGDGDATDALLHELQPTAVVHCAAITNVDWCEEHAEETTRVNVTASEHLARIASETGAAFVYISTDSVFDGNGSWYAETDATGPVNVYARSKLAGEVAVAGAHADALVVRTDLYGRSPSGTGSLVEWVYRKLAAGEQVPGFDDVIFNPLLTDDISDAVLDAIQAGLTGTYHLASPETCSKFAFAQAVAEVFGFAPSLVRPVSVATVTFKAPRPLNTTLDGSKLEAALGRKMPSLLDGLRRLQFNGGLATDGLA